MSFNPVNPFLECPSNYNSLGFLSSDDTPSPFLAAGDNSPCYEGRSDEISSNKRFRESDEGLPALKRRKIPEESNAALAFTKNLEPKQNSRSFYINYAFLNKSLKRYYQQTNSSENLIKKSTLTKIKSCGTYQHANTLSLIDALAPHVSTSRKEFINGLLGKLVSNSSKKGTFLREIRNVAIIETGLNFTDFAKKYGIGLQQFSQICSDSSTVSDAQKLKIIGCFSRYYDGPVEEFAKRLLGVEILAANIEMFVNKIKADSNLRANCGSLGFNEISDPSSTWTADNGGDAIPQGIQQLEFDKAGATAAPVLTQGQCREAQSLGCQHSQLLVSNHEGYHANSAPFLPAFSDEEPQETLHEKFVRYVNQCKKNREDDDSPIYMLFADIVAQRGGIVSISDLKRFHQNPEESQMYFNIQDELSLLLYPE